MKIKSIGMDSKNFSEKLTFLVDERKLSENFLRFTFFF